MANITYNTVGSIIKTVASSKVDISKDLQNDSNKSIAELINEQKEEEKQQN
jgi:hypothetical protein